MTLKEISIKREWFCCPNCGCKLLIYDNTARVKGVYIKCRICKKEIEVKL